MSEKLKEIKIQTLPFSVYNIAHSCFSEGCLWEYTTNRPTSMKLWRNVLQLARIRKFEGAPSESYFFADVSTFLP